MPTAVKTVPAPAAEVVAPAPSPKTGGRFEWVDLLRGLSAFGVVLFHSRVDLYAGWNEIRAHPGAYSSLDKLGAYASLPLAFMGSGVMLFFILSGFCVHYPYAAARKDFKAAGYAARRFLRIYPPYVAAIILTLLLELWAARIGGPAASDSGTIWRSLFMVQNYGSHPGQMTGNPSLWSLPVEIELYAVYPIFLWLLRRYGIGRSLLVTGIVSALSLLAIRMGATFLAGGFLTYWVIWCAGAALAEAVVAKKLAPWRAWMWSIAGVCLVGAVGATVKYENSMAKGYLWTGFFLCVIMVGLSSEKIKDWLEDGIGKKLALFGAITYSLYLIHFPVLRLMGTAWANMSGTKPGNILIPITGAILCVPIAYLFYWMIEKPSHGWARNLGKRLEEPGKAQA